MNSFLTLFSLFSHSFVFFCFIIFLDTNNNYQFDNLPIAFLTIFQCVTEEGWVDIMYQIQDGFNGLAGSIVFILLLVFGSFLLLNLTLAVLEDALSAQKEIEEEAHEEEQQALEESQDLFDGDNDGGNNGVGGNTNENSEILQPPSQNCRVPLFNMVTAPWFDLFIILLIIINTIVLAADHHPMEEAAEVSLEVINFVLTVLFSFELIFKLIGQSFFFFYFFFIFFLFFFLFFFYFFFIFFLFFSPCIHNGCRTRTMY
jgi:hypothetical protein